MTRPSWFSLGVTCKALFLMFTTLNLAPISGQNYAVGILILTNIPAFLFATFNVRKSRQFRKLLLTLSHQRLTRKSMLLEIFFLRLMTTFLTLIYICQINAWTGLSCTRLLEFDVTMFQKLSHISQCLKYNDKRTLTSSNTFDSVFEYLDLFSSFLSLKLHFYSKQAFIHSPP